MSISASAVSRQLRRHGFTPVSPEGGREGIRVVRGNFGSVSVRCHRHDVADDVMHTLILLGYTVDPNPHNSNILRVTLTS